MRRFAQVAVIDWSGENVAWPKGLAVGLATSDGAPTLLRPDGGWSRAGVLEWLLAHADAGTDLLIGLDLSPGLPFVDADSYFPGWPGSPHDARALWALVDRLGGDDPRLSANGFLAEPAIASHFRVQGQPLGEHFGTEKRGRLRACERVQLAHGLSPSSCLNLVGAAQVGKSSLTGMRVLHRLRGRIPVWPFDPLPERGPAIVEIYTTIAARAAGLPPGRSKMRDADSLAAALAALGSAAPQLDRYDEHSTDAILTAAWLHTAASCSKLWTSPDLTPQIAATEGWTFGVA